MVKCLAMENTSFLVLLLLFVPYVNAKLSNLRACADPECRNPVSVGVTVMNYQGIEPGMLSFRAGDEITIFSKSAGENPDLWGAEIRGKRGYVPKRFVREMKVFVRQPPFEIPTEPFMVPFPQQPGIPAIHSSVPVMHSSVFLEPSMGQQMPQTRVFQAPEATTTSTATTTTTEEPTPDEDDVLEMYETAPNAEEVNMNEKPSDEPVIEGKKDAASEDSPPQVLDIVPVLQSAGETENTKTEDITETETKNEVEAKDEQMKTEIAEEKDEKAVEVDSDAESEAENEDEPETEDEKDENEDLASETQEKESETVKKQQEQVNTVPVDDSMAQFGQPAANSRHVRSLEQDMSSIKVAVDSSANSKAVLGSPKTEKMEDSAETSTSASPSEDSTGKPAEESANEGDGFFGKALNWLGMQNDESDSQPAEKAEDSNSGAEDLSRQIAALDPFGSSVEPPKEDAVEDNANEKEAADSPVSDFLQESFNEAKAQESSTEAPLSTTETPNEPSEITNTPAVSEETAPSEPVPKEVPEAVVNPPEVQPVAEESKEQQLVPEMVPEIQTATEESNIVAEDVTVTTSPDVAAVQAEEHSHDHYHGEDHNHDHSHHDHHHGDDHKDHSHPGHHHGNDHSHHDHHHGDDHSHHDHHHEDDHSHHDHHHGDDHIHDHGHAHSHDYHHGDDPTHDHGHGHSHDHGHGHSHGHGHGHSHIPGYIPGFGHHYKRQQVAQPPPAVEEAQQEQTTPPPPEDLSETVLYAPVDNQWEAPQEQATPPPYEDLSQAPPYPPADSQWQAPSTDVPPSPSPVGPDVQTESPYSDVQQPQPDPVTDLPETEPADLTQHQSVTDWLSGSLYAFIPVLHDVEGQSSSSASALLFALSFGLAAFLSVYYLIQKSSREGALLAKISQLDQQLQEAQVAKDQTVTTGERSVENDAAVAELKTQNEKLSENQAVLQSRLADLQQENEKLVESNAALEKELEAAAEAGLEVNNMLSEVLASQSESNELRDAVEALQQQLNKQQVTMESLNQSLSAKCAENELLAAQFEETNEELEKATLRLKAVQAELEALKITSRDYQKKMVTCENDILKLRTENETLANEKRSLTNQTAALTKEALELREKVDKTIDELMEKEGEVQVLQEMLQRGKDSNEPVSSLLDFAHVKAQLAAAQNAKESLEMQLKEEISNKKKAEESLAASEAEIEQLRQAAEVSQKAKKEAETRLEVLSTYFKEKEAELQKELGSQEARRALTEENINDAVHKAMEREEQLELYKSQVETMKKEIEDQERSFKSRLAAQEKRAHESWVAARQAERRLEDVKQEAAQLRNRLTQVEKEKEAIKENGTLANGATDAPEIVSKATNKRALGASSEDLTPGDVPPAVPPTGLDLPPGVPPPPGLTFDHMFGPGPFMGPPPPFMPPEPAMMPPFGMLPPMPPPPPQLLPDHRPPPLGMISSANSYDVGYRREMSDPPMRRFPSPPRRYPSPIGSERSIRSDRSDRLDRYDDHYRPISPYGRHAGRPRSVGRSRDASPDRTNTYSPLPSPPYGRNQELADDWDDSRNLSAFRPHLLRGGSLRDPQGPKTSSPITSADPTERMRSSGV